MKYGLILETCYSSQADVAAAALRPDQILDLEGSGVEGLHLAQEPSGSSRA